MVVRARLDGIEGAESRFANALRVMRRMSVFLMTFFRGGGGGSEGRGRWNWLRRSDGSTVDCGKGCGCESGGSEKGFGGSWSICG